MTESHMLAYAAALTWIMIMASAMLRTNGSLALMFSNRDNLPPPSLLADRADRAAKNMIENLVLFVAAYLAAKSAGATGWKVEHGAQLFVAARVLYFGLYLAGVKVARTIAWFVGVIGIAMLIVAALAH
ncbi:MAG TPA: MAPEG family protein [Kofleriaceae bacterium]